MGKLAFWRPTEPHGRGCLTTFAIPTLAPCAGKKGAPVLPEQGPTGGTHKRPQRSRRWPRRGRGCVQEAADGDRLQMRRDVRMAEMTQTGPAGCQRNPSLRGPRPCLRHLRHLPVKRGAAQQVRTCNRARGRRQQRCDGEATSVSRRAKFSTSLPGSAHVGSGRLRCALWRSRAAAAFSPMPLPRRARRSGLPSRRWRGEPLPGSLSRSAA